MKRELKTVIEYLKELPEPHRSEAIKEAKKSFLIAPAGYELVKSPSAAILKLIWPFTKKGGDYYLDLYLKTKKKEDQERWKHK